MRLIPLLIIVLLVSGCAAPPSITRMFQSNAEIIEEAVLTKEPVDSDNIGTNLRTLVQNKSLFEQKKNFYRVRGSLTVFDHRALFVGLTGINDLTGPNVLLQGKPDSVAAAITRRYGIDFSRQRNAYIHEISAGKSIMVYEHSDNKTIVIGGHIPSKR